MPKVYGRKVKVAPAQSLWPNWWRCLFQALEEIPWVSLTAMSTLMGVLILFAYFRSIDYFPSDFSALISLGAAASICAIALLAMLSLGLSAPSLVYHHYSGESSPLDVPASVTQNEMIALQVLGVGCLSLWIGYPYLKDCGDLFNWFLIIGAPLFIFGFFMAWRLVKKEGTWQERLARSWLSIALATAGTAPLLILIPLAKLLSLPSILVVVLLLFFWGLTIFLNAKFGIKLHPIGVAIVALILIAYLYVLAPIATGQPAFFSAMVATKLGVRSDEDVRLLVSKQACDLVKNMHVQEGGTHPPVCLDGSSNEISAMVLSNVGERWLLEMKVAGASGEGGSRLRFTLPRSDTQVVSAIREKPATKKMVCHP